MIKASLGTSLCCLCLHGLVPSGKRQLCSKEGAAVRAPSRVLSKRALQCSPMFWAFRTQMLCAHVGAEGFIPLCSSSPSCSPPVLLSPAHPSPEPPWAPWGKVPEASWPLLPPGAGSWQLRCCHSSQALFWAACSFACWRGATLPGATLFLPRTTRSSRNGCHSACLGAAAPWLPSTSWASSTWPTLVTAGTAPQGSPCLSPGNWGAPL